MADKVLSYVAQSTVQGVKVRKLWQCCGEPVGFQGLPFSELRISACLLQQIVPPAIIVQVIDRKNRKPRGVLLLKIQGLSGSLHRWLNVAQGSPPKKSLM